MALHIIIIIIIIIVIVVVVTIKSRAAAKYDAVCAVVVVGVCGVSIAVARLELIRGVPATGHAPLRHPPLLLLLLVVVVVVRLLDTLARGRVQLIVIAVHEGRKLHVR